MTPVGEPLDPVMQERVAAVYRDESRRVLATLIRLLGAGIAMLMRYRDSPEPPAVDITAKKWIIERGSDVFPQWRPKWAVRILAIVVMLATTAG